MVNPYMNTGGSQGRPTDLHKGLRKKSSGGTNAKANAKRQTPGIWLQYGAGQWGFMRDGKVDWNAKGPYDDKGKFRGRGKIGNWQKYREILKKQGRLKNMPKPQGAKRPPAFYETDPFYREEQQNLQNQRDDRLDSYRRTLAQMKERYGLANEDIANAYEKDLYAHNASLAERGMTGSGINRAVNQRRDDDLSRAQAELELEMGSPRQTELTADIERTQSWYDSQLGNLRDQARDRYEALHDAPPPKFNARKMPKGAKQYGKTPFYQRGSTWFYMGKDGRSVSLGARTPVAVRLQQLKKQAQTAGPKRRQYIKNEIAELRKQQGS